MRMIAMLLAIAMVLFSTSPAKAAPAGMSEVEVKALVNKLVEALNARSTELLRSVYHDDLRMNSCNAFDRLIGNVVFGDIAEVTFENITTSTARILSDAQVTSMTPSSRVSVTFVLGWKFSTGAGASRELTLGVRWEVGIVRGILKVMRQQTKVSESEEECQETDNP
jgi:hypothetical protein